MTESRNKKALLCRRADAVARLVAPEGAASAFAIHLARVGRLAWASAQFGMWRYSSSGHGSIAADHSPLTGSGKTLILGHCEGGQALGW